MPGQLPSRGVHRHGSLSCRIALALPLLLSAGLLAQSPSSLQANPANNHASTPAGSLPPVAPAPQPVSKPPAAHLSARQLREADDAYLEGARQVQHKNVAAAEHSFERAVELNPYNRDYSLALIVARESLVTELVQSAARARLKGDAAAADALLNQARTLDPENPIVAQHFDTAAPSPAPTPFRPGVLYSHADPGTFPAADIASTLAGPVEFKPATGTRNLHLHGPPQSVLRQLYTQFGITTVFDASVTYGRSIDIDMDNVSFADATRIVNMAANTFAVAVQPKVALIAKDTQEMRDQLVPEVEETIYLPGLNNDEMQELGNIARNVFDLKQVATSATGGYLLLRGDEKVLRQVNATYDDMLDGGSDVLFDINLYEIDATHTRDLGAKLPSAFQGFSLVQSATSLIASNQSILDAAIQNGLLVLNGSASANELKELAFLIAAGVSGSSQFTSLLGTIGNFDGLPLLGVSVASGTTFEAMLTSSDSRLLDAVQIRSSNKAPASFRAGSRYPVVTAQYSSGIASSLPASIAGLSATAAALYAQYAGASSVTVPQFQFEDLGITLKMTPQIQHNQDVSLALDLKIEALAGGSIDSIPILNNRALSSTISVPIGKTAMLATLVTRNEVKALTGIPGLSDIPGFQGTDQDVEKDSTELLITITPHIVRTGRLNIASRRLATANTGEASH